MEDDVLHRLPHIDVGANPIEIDLDGIVRDCKYARIQKCSRKLSKSADMVQWSKLVECESQPLLAKCVHVPRAGNIPKCGDSNKREVSEVCGRESHSWGSDTVRDLVFDNGLLYAATENGLSISSYDGTTFTNRTAGTAGLASTSVNAIAVSGTTVYAATDSGLSISSDGGQSFSVTRTTAQRPGEQLRAPGRGERLERLRRHRRAVLARIIRDAI